MAMKWRTVDETTELLDLKPYTVALEKVTDKEYPYVVKIHSKIKELPFDFTLPLTPNPEQTVYQAALERMTEQMRHVFNRATSFKKYAEFALYVPDNYLVEPNEDNKLMIWNDNKDITDGELWRARETALDDPDISLLDNMTDEIKALRKQEKLKFMAYLAQASVNKFPMAFFGHAIKQTTFENIFEYKNNANFSTIFKHVIKNSTQVIFCENKDIWVVNQSPTQAAHVCVRIMGHNATPKMLARLQTKYRDPKTTDIERKQMIKKYSTDELYMRLAKLFNWPH